MACEERLALSFVQCFEQLQLELADDSALAKDFPASSPSGADVACGSGMQPPSYGSQPPSYGSQLPSSGTQQVIETQLRAEVSRQGSAVDPDRMYSGPIQHSEPSQSSLPSDGKGQRLAARTANRTAAAAGAGAQEVGEGDCEEDCDWRPLQGSLEEGETSGVIVQRMGEFR